MNHILSAEQFIEKDINKIFKLAEFFSKSQAYRPSLQGKLLGTLFFEPSTRTRLSFEAAMIKLGGQVISMENAFESSSNKKGETLEDTLKTVSQYVDIIVVRHPKANIISEVAAYSKVPIINAGDGHNEHPTQALLDYYTIKQNFKSLENLNVLFVGDLIHSRTIRSLELLIKDKVNIYKDINMLPEADVLYMTRNQLERKTIGEAVSNFILTKALVDTMKPSAIIMHPLPRNNEIEKEVDKDHRSKYFEQAQNGLWTRMALLETILLHNRNIV